MLAIPCQQIYAFSHLYFVPLLNSVWGPVLGYLTEGSITVFMMKRLTWLPILSITPPLS